VSGLDNPRVRASLVCPLCNGAKASGLVACWPCFRTSGLKEGDSLAEARVAAREYAMRYAPDSGRSFPPVKPRYYSD
jgi:hypothetical protein